MATVVFPERKPIPAGATEEDRRKLYADYRAEMVRLNPRHFNSDGTQKTTWQLIKGLFT